MKTILRPEKSALPLGALILLLFAFLPVSAQKEVKPTKIGTYDSRVITLAYSRSDGFREKLNKMQTQSPADIQGSDSAKKAQAAFKMITYQFLLHQEVFCTGTVASILETVKDKLPQIAKDAGVSMIVSKWELSFSNPSIEIVDLTMAIAQLFNPGGDFENIAKEISAQNPVPLEDFTIEEVVQMWKQFEAGEKGK